MHKHENFSSSFLWLRALPDRPLPRRRQPICSSKSSVGPEPLRRVCKKLELPPRTMLRESLSPGWTKGNWPQNCEEETVRAITALLVNSSQRGLKLQCLLEPEYGTSCLCTINEQLIVTSIVVAKLLTSDRRVATIQNKVLCLVLKSVLCFANSDPWDYFKLINFKIKLPYIVW